MRNVLICTVGTSLKGNLANAEDKRFLKLLAQNNIKGISLELAEIEPQERLAGAEINSITSISKIAVAKFLHGRTNKYLVGDISQ